MTVITIFDMWELDDKKRSRTSMFELVHGTRTCVCVCDVKDLSKKIKCKKVKKVKLYCGKVWPHFLMRFFWWYEREDEIKKYFSYYLYEFTFSFLSSTLSFENCTPETHFLCLLDKTISFKVFLLFPVFEWWNIYVQTFN